MSENFDIPEMEFLEVVFPDGRKISIMLPVEIARNGRLRAEALGMSFNDYILLLVSEDIERSQWG